MSGTGCYNCLRFLVVTVSMLVMTAALCLVSGTSWVVVNTELYRQGGQGSYTNISLLTVALLVVGGTVVLLATVGCCGALTQSRGMVAVFCICLMAIVVGEVTLVVMVWLEQFDYHSLLTEAIRRTVITKYQPDNLAMITY
eukprot:GFUD01133167.1.p1 GENE.GFUD01133167.1~~GFUD01133167.1.p1  ORF type:complete len:141 (-),score=40.13 GFUD01133167.1:4-426(-)